MPRALKTVRLLSAVLIAAMLAACARSSVVSHRHRSLAVNREASLKPSEPFQTKSGLASFYSEGSAWPSSASAAVLGTAFVNLPQRGQGRLTWRLYLAALAFPISRLRSRTVVAVKQPAKSYWGYKVCGNCPGPYLLLLVLGRRRRTRANIAPWING